MSKFDYDLFVIGAGSGGVRLARMSAGMGASVAVAEDRYLGGTCVNVGCVPKKLFVYASHVPEDLEDSAGFGWQHGGELKLDWATLIQNKNTEIKRLNGIYQSLLENSGAQIINGRAEIKGPHEVEVDGQSYTAERIVIATGSWPRMPDFEGAELAKTSNEFFFLDELPSSVTVLGGGYIAIELAGILHGMGVKTKIVYRGDTLLRGFDNEVRKFVMAEVIKKGIELVLEDNISKLAQNDDGGITVSLESGVTHQADLVLAAIGRTPLTEGLGLESVNLELAANGEIKVNQRFQTSVPSVYAIGDVIGGPQLTPIALAEGMFLANDFFATNKPAQLDYSNIPTAVFCQPNIGTVGLTEEEARSRYPEIDVYVSSFRPMKHTMSGRDERSLMKLIVDRASDKVVGAHMVGSDAGEVIQGLAVAIKAGATKATFDSTIGIHPTAAEEFVTMRQVRAD
jgi:glutathione reductase (NADPH)